MGKAFTEEELLPLSALQHLLFCERQCALIHLEGLWLENQFTVEGRIMHEKTHQSASTKKKGVRVEYALPLHSFRLGLAGQADVVEFYKKEGGWQPFPVEYKRGRPKANDCDRVQLCAQAMCLEEMLEVEIAQGAIFYGKNRRRTQVSFDEELRGLTIDAAYRLHEIIRLGITPKAKYEKKCLRCSLVHICLPKVTGSRGIVGKYLSQALAEP